MKVVEVTCLSVSRTDPVKLLRLMSSIIGSSASNPRGGRLSVSSEWSSFPRAFDHSEGLSAIRCRIAWRTSGSGIHNPPATKHSPGSRCR